jgi:hypothetical protein
VVVVVSKSVMEEVVKTLEVAVSKLEKEGAVKILEVAVGNVGVVKSWEMVEKQPEEVVMNKLVEVVKIWEVVEK